MLGEGLEKSTTVDTLSAESVGARDKAEHVEAKKARTTIGAEHTNGLSSESSKQEPAEKTPLQETAGDSHGNEAKDAAET